MLQRRKKKAKQGKKTRRGGKKGNKYRHAESGTHLAASRSSSFLYSPRWLQKIMVSDNGSLTHNDHTHTHMIEQREQPQTHTHVKAHRRRDLRHHLSFYLSSFTPPPLLLLLLPSLPFSLSAHPSGSGCRDDALPAATTARSLFGRRAAD